MPIFKRIAKRNDDSVGNPNDINAGGAPVPGGLPWTPERPTNAQPLVVPPDDVPDVPNARFFDGSMQKNEISLAPGDPREIHLGLMRAAQALQDAAKTLTTFTANRVYEFDIAAYQSAENLVHALTLRGPAIRSVYVAYGRAGQTGGAGSKVNVFRSSVANGVPLMSVSWLTFQVMNVGDGIFDLSVLFPVLATSSFLQIVITDDVWTPTFGTVV